MQWNVRSFNSNKPFILQAIDSLSPDVICVQETKGKPKQNFSLPGYLCTARKDREKSAGVGVAICTKLDIATSEIETETDLELVSCLYLSKQY